MDLETLAGDAAMASLHPDCLVFEFHDYPDSTSNDRLAGWVLGVLG